MNQADLAKLRNYLQRAGSYAAMLNSNCGNALCQANVESVRHLLNMSSQLVAKCLQEFEEDPDVHVHLG